MLLVLPEHVASTAGGGVVPGLRDRAGGRHIQSWVLLPQIWPVAPPTLMHRHGERRQAGNGTPSFLPILPLPSTFPLPPPPDLLHKDGCVLQVCGFLWALRHLSLGF